MPVSKDDALAWWNRFYSVTFAAIVRKHEPRYARRRVSYYREAEKRIIAAATHADDVNELAGAAMSVFDQPKKG